MNIRYIKFTNDVGCIAHMRILWNANGTSGEYEIPGNPDILYNTERTIDMKANTGIPAGAEVELYVEIAVCKDQRAGETHKYDPNSGEMVCYMLDGSIISNELIRTSPKFYGE